MLGEPFSARNANAYVPHNSNNRLHRHSQRNTATQPYHCKHNAQSTPHHHEHSTAIQTHNHAQPTPRHCERSVAIQAQNSNAVLRIVTALSICLLPNLSFATTTHSHAATPNRNFKPIANVQGNPVAKKDNYTLSSNKNSEQTIDCIFINTGDHSADLHAFVDPTTQTPAENISLEKGSATQPFQLMKSFHLKLADHWWCRASLPNSLSPEQKWNYCAYFSIADAAVKQNNPFTAWDNTIYSKSISYNCRVKKPDSHLSFFYFK